MNITTIANNFEVVLRNYGYKCTSAAILDIVSDGINNRLKLIELFRKHPNWNENSLRIIFRDTSLNTGFYSEEISVFIDCLESDGIAVHEDVKKFLLNLSSQFFNNGMKEKIEKINLAHPSYHLRTNMKTSKAIGKICREEGWNKSKNYNKAYTRLCNNINPRKDNITTIISVNPIDFLLMSHGKEWDSCHNIKDGDYMAGTLSYIAGKDSFLYYTIKESEYTNSTPTALMPKYLRQVWGYKDGCLFQSRLYPQTNDSGSEDLYNQIRKFMQEVISECENKTNQWLTKKNVANTPFAYKIASDGSAYRDWTYSSLSTSTSISKPHDYKDDFPRMYVAGFQCCICCGTEFYDDETLYCECCR